MRIDSRGTVTDEPRIRAGFIGCGSHSFRNIFPTFQFAPVDLIAVCDLDIDKANAFAAQFAADSAYDDYEKMLAEEELDAVFVVTNYDDRGRPRYPEIASRCLAAGVHVWIEKPPAASCAEIERMQAAAAESGKHVLVGLKKMFFPANEKAKSLMDDESFGKVSLVTMQYPVYTASVEQLDKYMGGERDQPAVGFLDHICHPASLMVFLLGMPDTLFYQRTDNGAAVATFTFASGAVAAIACTRGATSNGGMERTMIVSEGGRHITVENNVRVTLHRTGPLPYGASPDFFAGDDDSGSLRWEPEFSLGQLYNKGLFLLGYYNEVNEFARCILEQRPPAKGTLEQALGVTRIFEAFAEGPGKLIDL